jgi:hypothetical protein
VRGTVFIAPVASVPDGAMIDPTKARFWVSWQDDDEPSFLGDDEVDGAEAAIVWGRERSDTVLIRLGHRGDTYFSAGSFHARADDGPLPVWPPTDPPPGGWWEPPKVPTLLEIEHVETQVASGERSAQDAANWAMDRLRPSIDENAPEDIRAALFRLIQLAPPGPRGF